MSIAEDCVGLGTSSFVLQHMHQKYENCFVSESDTRLQPLLQTTGAKFCFTDACNRGMADTDLDSVDI